jgi:hypothetical protein
MCGVQSIFVVSLCYCSRSGLQKLVYNWSCLFGLDADNQLWVFITLIPGAKVCAEVQEGVACIYLGVVTLSWTVSIAQQKSIYTTYPDCHAWNSNSNKQQWTRFRSEVKSINYHNHKSYINKIGGSRNNINWKVLNEWKKLRQKKWEMESIKKEVRILEKEAGERWKWKP